MLPSIYVSTLTIDVARALAREGYSYVYLASLHVQRNGGLTLNNAPLTPSSHPELREAVQMLNDGGAAVLPSLGGWDSSDEDYQNAMREPHAFRANLLAVIDAYGFAGIDLDLEAVERPYSYYRDVCANIANFVALHTLPDGYRCFATASPYTAADFWIGLLRETIVDGVQSIDHFNLQVFGGADYATWHRKLDDAGVVADSQAFLSPVYDASESTPRQLHESLRTISEWFPRCVVAAVWKSERIEKVYALTEYADAILGAKPAVKPMKAVPLPQRKRVRFASLVAV